ncbi:MAG: SpoIIE family protein phosphatase [Cyclobacteriaceae bacterium]|nr:SpoIIE family protein phosphatase [Cyclobacteriaceae bacterium]
MSPKSTVRLTTFTAVLAWIALTVVDLFLGFELKNNVNTGVPNFLSGTFLTVYIVALFYFYKQKVENADSINFIDLLWRVFVTGLVATIVSVFIQFFLSFIAGTKLGEHELMQSFLYHINLGLILAFVISTYMVWKKLILYQKTKSLIRTWQVFEYSFLVSLLFYFLPYQFFDIPFTVVFAFLVSLGLIVSLNLKWVAYLNFKQKWKSILLVLLVILYLTYFLVYIIRNSGNGILISDLINHVSVLAVFAFILFYAIASLLVTLFNLPTTSVFEQKLEEVVNFQRLSQSSQTGQNQDEIFELLLDSSMSATFARAAWFEPINQTETVKIIRKNIPNNKIQEVKDTFNNQRLKKTVLPAFRNIRGGGDSTLIENISDSAYKSILVYPLEVQNEKIGTMVLLKEVSDGFNKDGINIVNTFGNQAAVSIENYRLLQSAIENERYQEELNIAKRVHESLLPSILESNDHFDISAFSGAADEVGGDYFDFHRISEDKLVLVIGDVSGKGTSAAFNMSQMKGVFHSLAQLDLSPAEFLGRANDALSRCLERTSFITLSYYVVDTALKSLEFSRAGHCPSIFYKQSQGEVQLIKSKGLGLGIIRDQEYCKYIETNNLNYTSGDLLVLYTDGITEAKNPANEEFGYDRLQQVVQNNVEKSAKELQDIIIDTLYEFTQTKHIEDDYTTMILKFK